MRGSPLSSHEIVAPQTKRYFRNWSGGQFQARRNSRQRGWVRSSLTNSASGQRMYEEWTMLSPVINKAYRLYKIERKSNLRFRVASSPHRAQEKYS